MAISGYVTAQEIVDFMELINPEFLATDINDMIVNSTYEIINKQIGGEYEIQDLTLYQDGRGTKEIFCPQIPMVAVTNIATVALDGTETAFTINGKDRNIWWDASTGKIWVESNNAVIEKNGSGQPFPDYPNSVKIEGRFGEIATDLVKVLQLMMILKQYSLLQPALYASDIISEKIGRYEYKLANASNVAPENQRKGLDGYIEWLFKQLPNQENNMGLEAI